MFAKSTLASAVAAALGVSAIGAAQADSVFFPYVAMSDTIASIVSVVNTSPYNWFPDGTPPADGADGKNLHYRLYYKSGDNAADNLAPCQEYNEYLPTSKNDIQTIDLSGQFGADTMGVLFNDPSVRNNWKASPATYAMGESVKPARGYLYVDNFAPPGVDTLTGSAFMFEFATGSAWGYEAYSRDGDPVTSSLYADYTWAASKNPHNVSIMPFTEMMTTFFVTPVSGDQAPDFQNNYRSRVEFITSVRGDLYDRDEGLVSGTVSQDVVCVGRVDAATMLTAATLNRLKDGGWGTLRNYRVAKDTKGNWVPAMSPLWNETETLPADMTTADQLDTVLRDGTTPVNYENARGGAVVIKLEYSMPNVGTFNGETVGGTFNNGVVLQPEAIGPNL